VGRVSQVAFSLVPLMGAHLFARTFRNLTAVKAGFQEDHVADSDYTPLRLKKDGEMKFNASY
jgi:hypothetical protein